jgi:hypothetical protein
MTRDTRINLTCLAVCVGVLLVAGLARCQERIPHPYVSGSFNLMPGGYAAVAWGAGAGLMWDAPHLVFDSFVGYDTGHKVNDATAHNNKGHDRFLRGSVAFKRGLWYVGPGARWSQLSTTNYTKGGPIYAAGSWHPEFGGGRDWDSRSSGLFMRTQVLYMFHSSKEVTYYPDHTSCDGCGNGSQGLDVSLWFPSPSSAIHHHWYVRMNSLTYRFHDTITDPKNVALTWAQSRRSHITNAGEFMLLYRF